MAMCQAAFGQMELPVRGGRNGLQAESPGRSSDHGEGEFAQKIGFTLIQVISSFPVRASPFPASEPA